MTEYEIPLELISLVVEVVDDSNGMRSTELAVCVVESALKRNLPDFDADLIPSAMAAAVQAGLIQEIEYTCPPIEQRVRSLYLPLGARFLGFRGNQIEGDLLRRLWRETREKD